ncbi:BTB/POZ domain-containing protein [Rhizophagus diaphanus]|nr:BTB/POZ domain-containing protein [Rhizophagus diaphanus] [Rhizophagus sp. MUCL 43196]
MSTHTYPNRDILIVVENVSFKVHKIILSLASAVFKDMIDHACEEEIPILVIEHENAQDFNDLLSFIYPHIYAPNTWNNVERLLGISDKFVIESLIIACKKFLEDNYRSPMLTFLLADTYNFKSLYKESSKLILSNYQDFIHEPLFKRFSEKARSSLNER